MLVPEKPYINVVLTALGHYCPERQSLSLLEVQGLVEAPGLSLVQRCPY